MIASGEKTEEYRAMSKHWKNYFGSVDNRIKLKGKTYSPEEINICFSNGYAKDRRQMVIELIGVWKCQGREEWGAEHGVYYYALFLGKILEKNF